ncbi:MAG: FAD-dependent oxidoreductase [Pseudomonadota bacterium]
MAQQAETVEIVGAGVVGLTAAHAFATRGCAVRVISASGGPGAECCSWWAGGMLAPGCEMEAAEPLIGALGGESIAFWREVAEPFFNGTLVVAPPRDAADLRRFARMTQGWQEVAPGDLEPDLSRFARGLHFPAEGHMDPRSVLPALVQRLEGMGVVFETGIAAPETQADLRIDARGLAAADTLPDLRGVKGEMLLIRSQEIKLSRPVRLLHPRYPLYIVPRGNGVFMVGATMIESAERGRATVRSALELLGAAYALHPALGEAEILEIGVDARPAFPDNLPRLRWVGPTLYINGMFRHGFLCAPAMARRAAEAALDGAVFPEVMDADHRQRHSA